MIEIAQKSQETVIKIPKNTSENVSAYTLEFYSELSKKKYTYEVENVSNGKRYYQFVVDTTEIFDGEYNYTVSYDDVVTATGLARIGKVSPSESAKNEDYTIIQYDDEGYYPALRLEDKTVVYDANGEYTITPGEGFYGINSVEVTVDSEGIPQQEKDATYSTNGEYEITPDEGYALSKVGVKVDVDTDAYYREGYDDGYASGTTEGYASGVTDGVAEQKAKLVATAFTENNVYTREDGFNSVEVRVDTQSYYERGYENGYASGVTDGYASGSTEGYASGVTDGVAEQKAKLVTTAVTVNGTYSREDGYSSVTVAVPSDVNNQNKSITATTNGDITVTPDLGYSGLGQVDVKVNVPTGSTINNQTKNITIHDNGATAVTFDNGYTGLQIVNINTAVPTGSTINNQNKTLNISSAGTYTVTYDSGYTGLGTVTVNVSGPAPTPGNLFFTILTGGTIEATIRDPELVLRYSLDSGETWNQFTSDVAVNVSAGDVMMLSGNKETADSTKYSGFRNSTAYFNVEGSLMALAGGASTLKNKHSFYRLFSGTNVVNAENLVLPSNLTNYCYSYMFNNCSSLVTAPSLPVVPLTPGCYSYMFAGCTSLTTAPVLPATDTDYEQCYVHMFEGCTSLNYIKCMSLTPLYTTQNTSYWVYRVASTGTFVKNANATWENTFDNNHIPTGWTVITAND